VLSSPPRAGFFMMSEAKEDGVIQDQNWFRDEGIGLDVYV